MPEISHLLRPDIAGLEPYTPIVPLEVLAERLGRPIEQIIKLDANENPFGPSPRALAALASYPHYAIYPDPEHNLLRDALARYSEQPRERIICGAGSDELIDLLMRAFLVPGDAIINCGPTFGMYPFDAQLFAANVIHVPRTSRFEIDIEAIAEAVETHQPKMVFIANPNNPTGTLTPRAEIERLLELPLLVVIDEAYAEFAGTSVVDLVGKHANLVVLRTFSKWAGLAGLRVGYAVAPEALLAHLWKIKQPYNVNVAAEQAAIASLDDLDYLIGNVMRLVAERERLFEELSALPFLHPYPSRANFILCRVHSDRAGRQGSGEGKRGRGGVEGRGRPASQPAALSPQSSVLYNEQRTTNNAQRTAQAVRAHLESHGVLIRYYTTPALADCIRISVGTPQQNDTLLAALREFGEL